MNAEIISIGTELLMGQITNTNAQYLSQKLSELGINVYYQIAVGDNEKRITQIFNNSYNRSDLLLITGGLGPTQDDLTKEIISKILGLNLKLDKLSLDRINKFFKKLNIPKPENNNKQALFPVGSIILKNNNGTAPGCIIEKNSKMIVLLPGPPRELKPMFEESVFPYLTNKSNLIINSKYINLFGIGESSVEKLLNNLISSQTNPTIATYANLGEVTIRVTSSGIDEANVNNKLNLYTKKISNILDDYIISTSGETMEECVFKLLSERKLTISFAESCTGGMISSKITNISGVSNIFTMSVVTYSNESKIKMLGVKKSTLETFGAVSKETAKEMAIGIQKLSKADIGFSITGIAGPTGNTIDKPIGLVYISLYDGINLEVKKLNLSGNRESIREMATLNALNLILEYLK